ncbi:MAG: 50S ribosomal protein L24 [Erysipelotrichaceae bacterium]|jgi:large subunit ribosomal protein L24|nr:50S ribosomal protein L24 [Erysipelotrichaceae bacterium]
MKIKKGDKVKVITGASKGATGEVIKALPKTNQVVVEGVNLVKKNLKPTQANPDGGAIEKEAPIHVSNVSFLEVKAKKATKAKKEVKEVKEEKKVAKKPAKKAVKE